MEGSWRSAFATWALAGLMGASVGEAGAASAVRSVVLDRARASEPVDRFHDLSVGADFPGTLRRGDSQAQLKTAVGVCTCQDCVLDMAAFALNNVKPAYRVSLMGSVYARAGRGAQHAQGISKAVREAIAKVKENPSHD